MTLLLKWNAPAPKDVVLIEPDGTILMSFMRTGFIKAVSRTRYPSGDAAATAAFMVTEAVATQGEGDAPETAPHALAFVSEAAGSEKVAIVERFNTADDARAAWDLVNRALQNHVRAKRRKGGWGWVVRYVGAPLLVFVVGMAGVRFLDSHNGSLEAINALVKAAGMATPETGIPTLRAAEEKLPPLSMATGPQASKVGQDLAATSKMAMIHFGLDGQPPEKTLYVFSDPNCPACKQFESHVADLAKDFSIYILPVGYQGDGNGHTAAYPLCATLQQTAWKAMISGGSPLPAGVEVCKQGLDAVRANMEQFERLGFNSTPRVVSGTGYAFPEGAGASMIRLQVGQK